MRQYSPIIFLFLLFAISSSYFLKPLYTSPSKAHKVIIHKSVHVNIDVHQCSALHSSVGEAEGTFSPPSSMKGFGKIKDKSNDVKEEKDAGTRTYESQSKRGVPEYNIFIRPSNGSETDWVPVGSMTIQR